MNLKQVLAAFPPNSAFRKVLPGLLSSDDEVWEEAYCQLRELDRLGDNDDPMATTWKLSEDEALAVMNAAFSLPFEPPKHDWKDAVHDLLFALVRSPHASLLPGVRDAYPRLTARAKCAALSLFGAIGTRDAAKAFVACVRQHGWPQRVYSRVFKELEKLLDHADVLFPDLIQFAGPDVAGVTDVLMVGLADGKVDLAAGKIDLEPVAPLVVGQLKKSLKAAGKKQHNNGVAWRFGEKYFGTRRDAGCWLDIAGYLKSSALDPLLVQALGLSDPRLLAFAGAALLRRGGTVGKEVLDRVAAYHETRELLFDLLRSLGRLDLFPAAWRTWDAFAAANMVAWLIYPTELGREPDELEKMAVFTAKHAEGEQALYVWRFRSEGGPWYAAISGPYNRVGRPLPLHGHLTFSRFDEWETATAEGHAEAALGTLRKWRRQKGV
jgi:hypothetical protein